MAKPKRKGVYARDVDRLNLWFAVVAIASLLSVLWMVWDDYARPWKSYQRQFRVIEAEVTQQQLADEQAGVDQQRLAELRQQRDAAEETLSGQQAQLGELESELTRVNTRLELADQNLRFARSTYDARRWVFEEARKHEGEEGAASERATLDASIAEVAGYAAEVEELTLERDALQADRDDLTGAGDEARSAITAMEREIERLQARVNSLRFNWVYYLRNAPFMDSFNPSVRINQVVLNNVRFDLNFTDAPRVDRCQSCHLGAALADYATSEPPFTAHRAWICSSPTTRCTRQRSSAVARATAVRATPPVFSTPSTHRTTKANASAGNTTTVGSPPTCGSGRCGPRAKPRPAA